MSNPKILVVDDVFINRFLLSEILDEIGFDYYLAKNGKEAIDELLDNKYDLVLMDIEMPVMNGLESTRFIRENLKEPKRSIPIIALTAHNPKMFFNDFSDVGFSNLLTKPYSIKKIKEMIFEFVEIKKE